MTARGTFEVRITPDSVDEPEAGATLGRSTLDKTYLGDLDATATGTMLTAVTGTEGSAAYVAVERISGRLNGKAGTFALVHRGVMDRGEEDHSMTIVPDSGTGELSGIAGTMTLQITGGVHRYELTYSLPEAE